MYMKSIRVIAWISGFLVVVFTLLFIYKQSLLNTKASINAERFAHYSTFISLFFSLLTIGLLFYTYQQTRETHRLTVNTFEQAKKDSVETTFFNLIQNYRIIVERLHNRITVSLSSEFLAINARRENFFDVSKTYDKDFFELMYRILHLEYKQGEPFRDPPKIANFFKNYNWVMGHYFRSVLYFVKWVYQNGELSLDQKRFYIEFIQMQLTSDEMRLLFYFVISRESAERKELSAILKEHNFFNIVKPELLWYEDDADWKEFEKS